MQHKPIAQGQNAALTLRASCIADGSTHYLQKAHCALLLRNVPVLAYPTGQKPPSS